MSKRTLLHRLARGQWRTVKAIGFLLVLSSLLSPVAAQRWDNPTVVIENNRNTLWPGDTGVVDVTLYQNSSQYGFGGFDLLMGFDANVLTFLSATQGALLDSCGWEYFNYRSSPMSPAVVCTVEIVLGIYAETRLVSGLTRVVALADINNGAQYPSCHLEGLSGNLFSMTFAVAPDTALNCYFWPISFFWKDCGDNIFSSATGDSLFFAQQVYGFYQPAPGDPFTTPSYLPSCNGTPDSCVAAPGKTSMRLVDFREGGVDLQCIDTIDVRGDLNLNGIAYELADWILYRDYFLYGLSAFSGLPGSPDAQIAASDINDDGIPLTFRDFVYMWRVINGDAFPYPRSAGATANVEFVQDCSTKTLSHDFTGNLAGVYLQFMGTIIPQNLLGSTAEFSYVHRSCQTFVVLVSGDKDSLGSGPFLRYTGEGTLTAVETADWFDSPLTTTMSVTEGGFACGDVNGSGGINLADAVYLVAYIFGNGQPPLDVCAGDLDNSGLSDISEVVCLISYILGGLPL